MDIEPTVEVMDTATVEAMDPMDTASATASATATVGEEPKNHVIMQARKEAAELDETPISNI